MSRKEVPLARSGIECPRSSSDDMYIVAVEVDGLRNSASLTDVSTEICLGDSKEELTTGSQWFR